MSPPRVLTIAGSDSGGGAGIQADLKTFLSLGTYGLSVLTALTAQSTTGVTAIHPSPPDFVVKQLQTVAGDIEIDAVKIGMLCDEHIVKALASELASWTSQDGRLGGKDVPMVLDPVMVSTSGSLLLSENAVLILIESILPLCSVLTPNLPEAKQLLKYADRTSNGAKAELQGLQMQSIDDMDLAAMMEAAHKLASLGPKAVLVKGGHAKLSRRQVEDQIQKLSSNNETEVLEANELKAPLTGVAFPCRPTEKGKTGATGPDARLGDAKHLAGVEGARISRSGNITVIRTDEQPFAEVLRTCSSQATAAHDTEPVICDVLYENQDGGHYTLFLKPYVQSTATHGTGCTLSSALAASLSQGHSLLRSTAIAIEYVQRAISCGIEDLGRGSGPLDHSFPIQPRGLLSLSNAASIGLNDRHPYPLCTALIANSLPVWKKFVRHPFVLGLGDGSLSSDSFAWFLKQDYIFLRHYARIWSHAATYPNNSFDEIATFAEMAQTMAHEAKLHVELCERSFGITRQVLERGVVESAATLAYTRYVMDVGRSGGLLELLVSLAPCMLGYAEVGLFLRGATQTNKDYQAWIDGYAAAEFQDAVKKSMREYPAFGYD